MKSVFILALSVVILVTVPSVPAFGDTYPLVAATTVAPNSGASATVTHSGGDLEVDDFGAGQFAATVSEGIFVYDASNSLLFGFTFTGVNSNDRHILHIEGVTQDYTIHFPGDGHSDSACLSMCIGLTMNNLAAGTYKVVGFIAGLSGPDSVEIHANADTAAPFQFGPAFAASDPDFAGGVANIQIQDSSYPTGGPVGVKAIQGASVGVSAPAPLTGVFYDVDFKVGCAFELIAAVPVPTFGDVNGLCIGSPSSQGLLTYTGPNGSPAPNTFYTLDGLPAGAYAFSIEAKADAYSPQFVYDCDPATGSVCYIAYPGEDVTLLAGAAIPF
ncbi:MAG: hypothetical protein ACYDCK_05530 [Thermoplasmatota archaeon]